MKINKGQFRLSSRTQNFKFELHRGQGHLFSYIKNRVKWHLYPRFHHVPKFPSHVDVELSSLCNLSCPMCYTTTDEFKKKINRKHMDFDLFKKIIDECSEYNLFSIRLSLRGEAFLNENIYEMIEYAKDKGIKEVSTLTHGGFLDEKGFQKLIDLDLDWLTISFDGIGETYDKIRYPLKFDDAVSKIKKYSEIKQKRGVVKPVIKVQTVWPAISKNPEDFYNTFNSITDQVASNPLIDYLGNDTDIEYENNFTCPQLWERLVIGADGTVMMCSNDEFEEYKLDNVNEDSIFNIWHGKKLTDARKIHLKHTGMTDLSPCKKCYLPRKTKRDTTDVDGRLIGIDNYVNRSQTVGK
ncbi:radical SAM/SPASM domain-containing protein [Nitrosopumilus sp.]|uniref:radical SAM/SPASM domain-containing protein n=1 Tax=Nitrosopumilus sp. TaxID=2024843 RepID=UPI002606B834|nr:radical SAM/SPASM domain-containing protein [Nitrosopumilus sp.]